MKWVITRDRINADCVREEDKEVGRGTGDLKDKAKYPIRFRLRDDDGITYFEGKGMYEHDGYDEEDFEPLDDFGVSYGCTEIQYYDKDTKKWATV